MIRLTVGLKNALLQINFIKNTFCTGPHLNKSWPELLEKASPLMKTILGANTKKQAQAWKSNEIFSSNQIEKNLFGKSEQDWRKSFFPMLAQPLRDETDFDKFCSKKSCELILDVKYDGQRTIIVFERGQKLQMISRNGKNQEEYYSELAIRIHQSLIKDEGIKSIKIDGEILAVSKTTRAPLSLNYLKKRRIKNEYELISIEDDNDDQEVQLLIYAFDVIQLNGVNLKDQNLIDRKKMIPEIQGIAKSQYIVVKYPQERGKIFDYFTDIVNRLYEGLILKGSTDKYFTNGTRSHWGKLKRGFMNTKDKNVAKLDLDLVVMGANKGKGYKNFESLTSFLVGCQFGGNIIPISNVGSGLNEQTSKAIASFIQSHNLEVATKPPQYVMPPMKVADIYFKPKMIFEVHAQQLIYSPMYELGKSEFGGLTLRFPTFKKLRQDKEVKDSNTGEQILEMAKKFNFNL